MRNRYFIIFLAIMLLVGVGVLPWITQNTHGDILATKTQSPSLKKNDSFDHSDKVIHLGVQPLWLPVNLLTELMKRDAILERQLHAKGFTLRLHPYYKGSDLNVYLQKGDLVGGVGGDLPAISACATTGARSVALIDQNATAIVARASWRLDELAGKRIAIAYGSNAHYALLDSLRIMGIEEKQVTMVPMEVNLMPNALAQEQVDAFAAWQPIPAITLVTQKESKLVSKRLSTGYLYFHPTFMEQHPELVRLIVSSIIRSLNWLEISRGNLLAASQWAMEGSKMLTGKQVPLSVEQYAETARQGLAGFNSSPAIPQEDHDPKGRINHAALFLKEIGLIPNTISSETVLNCFTDQTVSEILDHQETYQLNTFKWKMY